jgi:histidine triad (HIT) family protein
MLTEEKLSQIKGQLLKQLSNFPEDQRNTIKEKITSMSSSEMEDFIKQNNLNYNSENGPKQECIFCSIANKKITSYILDENENFLAILELNPISYGHTLVLPKKHLPETELKEEIMNFAKKISQQILKKLNPSDIQFSKNEILEHGILDILPVYNGEKNLERKKASNEELISLQKKLTEKEELKIETPKEETKPKVLPKIKLRMP